MQSPGARTNTRAAIDALGVAYDAHAGAVYAFVRSMGAAPTLAEDILQEVFVRFAAKGVALDNVTNVRAYLMTTARREFYRWGTQVRRRREIDSANLAGAFEPADDTLSAEDAAAVEDALAQLPSEQREVVVMKFYGGLTFDEIAEVMGTSINTAASRYRYALDKLETLLGESNE